MPRPDFRKLAADRLGTPEPMSGRIAALLGIDARLLDTLLPVEQTPVSTPVRPSSRHASPTRFVMPLDVTNDAPAPKGIRPAPRSRSFAISAAMLAPAPLPPVLSVASAPVAAPASAPSRTGSGRKRPARRKSLVATAARGPIIEHTLSDRERHAIAAAILGTGSVEAAAAVTTKPAKRRTTRPRRVATPVAPVVATPVAPAAPVVATISTPAVTVTTTRSAVAQPGVPSVSGPSPVGDATGSIGALLTPKPVSAPVRYAPDETEQLLLGDASSGKREAAQAAFSDALSHLVTTLSAADGRPASELERARLRKFLQISRIYLDNLAVKLKD